MACRYFVPLVLTTLTILSGCATSGDRTGQTSIDRSFTTGGFSWSHGGTVYIFATARQSRGKVEVCAAQTATKGSVTSGKFNDSALDTGSIRVGGDRVLTGLGFANPLPETKNVLGKPATCVLTGKSWKPDYRGAEVVIDFPRFSFVD